MKVLFISNWHEQSGYSEGGRLYIQALDAAGVEVVPRRLNILGNIAEIPERILELESQSDKDCDYCIQYTVPSLMAYSGDFKKCIGLFAWETTVLPSNWRNKLSSMDEVWVINQDMLDLRSGLNNPWVNIQHPIDLSKSHRSYYKLDIPPLKDKFIFYFIGEFNRRKNLQTLLKAYYTYFTRNDNVGLLIKSNIPGQSPEVAAQHITNMCNEIKRGLKLYPNIEHYPPEVIITDRLSDDDMCRLHTTGDVYVAPSHGEAWNISCADAMNFGKPCLLSCQGGHSEMLRDSIMCIEGDVEPVFGAMESPQDLYNANEGWLEISVDQLGNHMQLLYHNENRYAIESRLVQAQAQKFSFSTIGNKMKEALCR